MNTTLLPYAQPSAAKFVEYMPNKLNEHNMSNHNELINMTSMRVLPLLDRAELRYGTHAAKSASKIENKWLTKLQLNKRETSWNESDFNNKLGLQAELGCLSQERRKGRLPRCNISLDENLLTTTGEKMVGFNAQNKDNFTPLMQAAATHRKANYIGYLISRGADVSLRDNEGNTALMWLIKSLNGLKDDALIKEKWRIIDLLQEKNDTLNIPGTAGYTPLMATVLGEDHKTFFKLLLNAAQTDATNNANETALHLAIKYDTHWMISVVLRYGAPDFNGKDLNGHTPFMLAAFRKNFDIMEFYIRRGVHLDNTDAQGWTVLMHAVNCGDVSMVEYLLSKGASANFTNRSNETAMKLALHKKNQKIVDVLSNAIAGFTAVKTDCLPASSWEHVTESAGNTAYIEDDALKNVAETQDYTLYHTDMPTGTHNATEAVFNAMTIGPDYKKKPSEIMDDTLIDKSGNSDYSLYENDQQKRKRGSADLSSSKSSGSSLFLSSRITGDVDKIYQSLKRIMSRRALNNKS